MQKWTYLAWEFLECYERHSVESCRWSTLHSNMGRNQPGQNMTPALHQMFIKCIELVTVLGFSPLNENHGIWKCTRSIHPVLEEYFITLHCHGNYKSEKLVTNKWFHSQFTVVLTNLEAFFASPPYGFLSSGHVYDSDHISHLREQNSCSCSHKLQSIKIFIKSHEQSGSQWVSQ